MNWTQTKQDMKQEIINNEPVAKLNEDGSISVEISNEFYQTLDKFCDAGKAEIKKSAFQVAMLSALGLAGATIAVNVDPSSINAVIMSAKAFTICGGLYIVNAFKKKAEAQYYYDHLEETYLKVAQRRYNNNQYYTVKEDGTIMFDQSNLEEYTPEISGRTR